MQKLIAKYGAAVHLAMLAVAPLFLFPFCGDSAIATVLLWLSVPACSWIVLEPSLRSGESLRRARQRVMSAICKDPLFWASLSLVLLTGVRSLNGGVSLTYDVESAKWSLSSPVLPLLPGCVSGTGFLPFAALVAGTVLMQGCRHSLGRSARMSFLLLSSALAGLAGVLAIVVGSCGNGVVMAATACSATASFYVGVAFCLYLLVGTAALFASFERGWNLIMPLFALSIGGTAAAGFLFSPPVISAVFAAAEVLLMFYVFVYSMRVLPSSGEFKLLVVSGISFTLGSLLLMGMVPDATQERLAVFTSLEFLTDSFVSIRNSLSSIALRSWLSNLWLGTGLGSFPLAFRFHAEPADWQLVRAGAQAVPNGWWFLLAERGVVGAVIVGLPTGFLVFTYIRRLVGWFGSWTFFHPCCCLTPLALAALAVSGLYGCALFRADVTIIALAMLSVSANSFPRRKRKDNG